MSCEIVSADSEYPKLQYFHKFSKRLRPDSQTHTPNPERVWGPSECWFTGGQYSDVDLDRGVRIYRLVSLSIVKVGGSASRYVDRRSLELGRIIAGEPFVIFKTRRRNLNFSLPFFCCFTRRYDVFFLFCRPQCCKYFPRKLEAGGARMIERSENTFQGPRFRRSCTWTSTRARLCSNATLQAPRLCRYCMV